MLIVDLEHPYTHKIASLIFFVVMNKLLLAVSYKVIFTLRAACGKGRGVYPVSHFLEEIFYNSKGILWGVLMKLFRNALNILISILKLR